MQFDRKARDQNSLTPTETAQYLGVCRTYIYGSIRRDRTKVTRIRRKTLISKADIREILDYLTPTETGPKESNSTLLSDISR